MPLIRMLRMITTSVAPAATLIPLVPDTRTEATWPPPPSSVSAFVIVTAPKPPGSSASISPPAAVFEIAPAQVLQGAVRLQGLASSPTPDTHVRVACALAGAATSSMAKVPQQSVAMDNSVFLMSILPIQLEPFRDVPSRRTTFLPRTRGERAPDSHHIVKKFHVTTAMVAVAFWKLHCPRAVRWSPVRAR